MYLVFCFKITFKSLYTVTFHVTIRCDYVRPFNFLIHIGFLYIRVVVEIKLGVIHFKHKG